MKKSPKVNEVNEFLEIASDFEDPLELLRESLSNSFDADAEAVSISIRRDANGSSIVIDDDGTGMNRDELASFFDLGNSTKTDSIGYKGHGTKIFYKSDRITVNTTKNGTTLIAEMDRPWEKLNNETLPKYDVSEKDAPSTRSGTTIKISGFRSGEGFSPDSLTYREVKNYLKWKTIAGSTAHFFDDDFHEMKIRLELDDEIDDSEGVVEMTNKFEFPSEQHRPSSGRFPAERMCKIYGPDELSVSHANGTANVEIVGMAGGKETRNELDTFGRHSTQFGIWLAKDHIKVERLNEAISHDNEFIHFLFVANCQELELAANRGKIRNKASSVYQALEEELSHYLSKVTSDPWFQDYLRARRQGELERRATSADKKIEERIERIRTNEFEPGNKAEVLFSLQEVVQQTDALDLSVKDYQPAEDVTAIIDRDGTLQSAAVWQTASDHLSSEAPLAPVDVLLCWEWGDKDQLREWERNGYLGNDLEMDFDSGLIRFTGPNGKAGQIEVLAVSQLGAQSDDQAQNSTPSAIMD
ncbi:ATP-binding protein [Haloarcula sediminis]|uniref:ATP-binding protein n=1 Tax=Haloarcula sediminis TaxID=3111777 RepID=UPI002D79F283|nr:ATP-binding protein [Haloarcula sp. CK38]